VITVLVEQAVVQPLAAEIESSVQLD